MNTFNRVIMRRVKLYQAAQRNFTQNTLTGVMNTDRNHKLRVMSTPEWPVPYWQRSFRHDPCVEDDTGFDITGYSDSLNDFHVIFAKEYLKTVGKGYVVEAVENHFDITKYTTDFEDSHSFTEAYIDDMLDSIDIVSRQNIKLLNTYDLADCLKE
uniref:Uncharacterized protein n=1 Tax=Euplotes harpa TaxID=151035 RepID=A0A7S3JLY8_9SPIT